MPQPISDDEREARGCWIRYMREHGESWAAIGRSLGMGGDAAQGMYRTYERMVRRKLDEQEHERSEVDGELRRLVGWEPAMKFRIAD